LNDLRSAPNDLRWAPLERRAEVARVLEQTLQNDPDANVRREAASELCRWASPAIAPALSRALKDPDFSVVCEALHTVETLKYPATAEAVAALLDSEEVASAAAKERMPQEAAKAMMRLEAAKVLKAIGSPAEPYVVRYLGHENPQVRQVAVDVLKEIGTEASASALREYISKTRNSGPDARAAGETLDRLNTQRFMRPRSPRPAPRGQVRPLR
jgi:HEAT repeat protein